MINQIFSFNLSNKGLFANRMYKYIFIVSVGVSLNLSKAYSQDLAYYHYTTSNGLPSSEIHDIIQDDWGYMWFSTDHGLCRYNGYNFENYSTRDGLSSNTVFNFYKRSNGDIWCSTFNQTFFIIRGRNPEFILYEYNKVLQNLSQDIVIDDIHFDKNDNKYVTFLSHHGYFKISSDGKVENYLMKIKNYNYYINYLEDIEGNGFMYSSNTDSSCALPDNYLNKSYNYNYNNYYRKGGVFFQNIDHLFFLNEDEIICINNLGEEKIISMDHDVIDIGKLDSSHFWVSTISGGVSIFDQFGNYKQSVLDGNSVTKAYVDHEDGLWISTLHNGVYHIKNKNIRSLNIENNTSGISDIVSDKKGNIWLGYYNGDVYRGKNNNFEQVYKASINTLSAHLFYEPTTEIVYYGSDGRISNSLDGTQVNVGGNLGFHVNSKKKLNTILLCHYNGIIYIKNDKRETLTGKRVHNIAYYKDNLYLASKSGLCIEKEGELILKDNHNSLLTSHLDDISVMGNKLVLASRGNGVLLYDEKSIEKISLSEGLTSDFVRTLFVEDDTTLWVGTNAGLNRIRFIYNNGFEIDKITHEEGLVGNEVTGIEVVGDTVWVGTQAGVSYFDKKILTSLEKETNYYLESLEILVNDQLWNTHKDFDLKYNQNRLEFHFSGISFKEGEKLIYRYKLENLETEWNYTINRNAAYPSLLSGTYRFLVQVKGENELWESQEVTIDFSIAPPYWQTWWFRVMILLSIFTLVYLFFRFRILTYNRNIIRELLRQLLKRMNRKRKYLVIKEQGKINKIDTKSICFVKSAGNYIDIHTDQKVYVIRYKIGGFEKLLPDPLEFLRVNRSYIVRLDKIEQKGLKELVIKGETIPIGRTYRKEAQKINL